MSADPGTWWRRRAGLEGRVAVVTGGAGGLGEAISLALAANGVRVALVDRDTDAVGRITALLDTDDHEHISVVGDVREPETIEALFGAAVARWGRIDILVNVVGGTFKSSFTEQGPRAWDALLRANLLHVLHSSQLAVRHMREGGRGGSIISLTTIEAHRAAPNFAVYSAAKAAVAHFSRSLALEVARDGIRVNCVAPDITPTPNMTAIAPDGAARPFDELAARIGIPMGRVGVPDDVAGAVVFLASDLASYITGTTLHPDGGTFASSGWFDWPGTGFANMPPPAVIDVFRTTED